MGHDAQLGLKKLEDCSSKDGEMSSYGKGILIVRGGKE